MIKENRENISTIFKEILSMSKNFGVRMIKEYLKEADDYIFNKVSRSNYWVKESKTRWLLTDFGFIKFKRRTYKNLETGKVECLVDRHLGLKKYTSIQEEMKIEIIDLILRTKSFKDTSELLGINISEVELSRIIKNTDIYVKPKKISDFQEKLFINIDGMKLHGNKIRFKGKDKKEHVTVVMFTGTSGGKRSKLLNKVAIPIKKGTGPEMMARIIEAQINAIYGDVGEVIVIGDGALWITSFANWLTFKTTRVIDKFHVNSKLDKILRKHCNRYTRLDTKYWSSFKTRSEFSEALYWKIADLTTGIVTLNETEKKEIEFLISSFYKWQITVKKNYPSAIEGIQSHLYSNLFKQKRLFGKENLETMKALVCAKYNGWEITLDKNDSILLRNLYNEDTYNSNWLSLNDSNIPTINGGASTSLGRYFMKLVN